MKIGTGTKNSLASIPGQPPSPPRHPSAPGPETLMGCRRCWGDLALMGTPSLGDLALAGTRPLQGPSQRLGLLWP